MTRRIAAVLSAAAIAILGSGSASWADHPKPDPRPTNGQDCQTHGNHGGPNRDHCGPTTTPTGGTPSTPATTTATSSSPVTSATATTTPSTTSAPSPSTTSSTPSSPATTSSAPSSSRGSTTAPSTRPRPSTPHSSLTATSPQPSAPSSTGELARTGDDLSNGAAVGIFLLLVGLLLWAFSRKTGDHQ